jgi:hypothetical protein
MKIVRLIVIIVSIVSIILTLLFITNYHVLKTRDNFISLLLIAVSGLNLVSMILSNRNDRKKINSI